MISRCDSDLYNGWPDAATQKAVEFFPNGFLLSAFGESMLQVQDEPEKHFVREMTSEMLEWPELIEALAGEEPDWSDVFGSLLEESIAMQMAAPGNP